MIAIWTALALAALFLLTLVFNALRAGLRRPRPGSGQPPIPENIRDGYAHGLGRMIACATVSHRGAYDDAEFAKLRDTVRALFPRFHACAEYRVFGEDCWVYRIPGADGARAVMLMSHHDVAEAGDAGAWDHPPFSGEVADGAVWGRGAVDTKGPLYAEFQAVEELLAEGWTPPCDFYLASSHNEEIAGDGIPLAVKYFQEKGVTFDFILDEGGAVIAPPMPGISQKCAMIAVHEKGRCSLGCRAEESASHGGLAGRSDTPVMRMAKFMTEMSARPPFRRRLYPEVRAMFTQLCPYMCFPLRLVFANLWCFSPLLLKLMPRLNPQAGAMVGTLCAFNSVEGSAKAHACSAEAFLRCVREEDLKADLAAFEAAAGRYGVTVERGGEYEYHAPADLSSPALAYVKECAAAVFPQCACAPFLLPAGTDARHFSALCRSVLRFAPIDLTPDQFASVHGRNENLDVKALADAVVFYKYLLAHLM